jgi:hypothetical protein
MLDKMIIFLQLYDLMQLIGEVTVGTGAVNLPSIVFPEVIRAFSGPFFGIGFKIV